MTIIRLITISYIFLTFAFSTDTEPTISILYFDNLTNKDKYEHLRKALTEMLISDMHQLGGITFVEREKIENVLQEMALGQSGLLDKDTAPQVGKLVGAQYIISGSYLTEKKKILITYKIIEIESTNVVASGNVKGKTGDILGVKDNLAMAVAYDLAANFSNIKIPQWHGEGDVIPIDNVTEFGRALDYKDQKNYQHAEEILKNIVTKNPDYKLFNDELKEIEDRLQGYDAERERLLKEKSKEPLTYQSFIQMSGSYASSMQYSKLLEYCRQLRNSPPKSPQGSMIQSIELIDYYIVLSLQSLKQLDGTVREGEYFIKTYPTSMYYNSVKNFVSTAINELKSKEQKAKQAETGSREFAEQLATASESQKQLLHFQIAGVYYGATLYQQALDYYQKIDIKEIEKQQITGDLVLFNIFMCHYGLLQKSAAKKVINLCEEQYPNSDYLSGMRSMVSVMAQ